MVDLIEIRMLALAGLLTVMVGVTLPFWAGVVVAERLRPVWQRLRAHPPRKPAVARVRC
jgi:hypothetical protein